MSQGDSRAGQSTIYGLFQGQVQRKGPALALEYQGRTWSFSELDVRVRKLAQILTDQGIRHGDRVAILSENRPEYIEAELACALIGAILACQNWRLAGKELQHCISLVTPKLLLVSARNLAKLEHLPPADLPVIIFGDAYEDLMAATAPAEPSGPIDPEDGALILYTSGTTGLPKGALISHRAQIARMCVMRLDTSIQEGDAFVAWSPMFHMAATDSLLGSLMSGSPVIVVDGLKLEDIVSAAQRHPLSWLVMMPGTIDPLISYLKEHNPQLKRIAHVGAMADLVPRQEIADLTRLLDAPFLNSFGSTETGMPPASASFIAPGDRSYSLSKRVNSLCEIRLVDEERRQVPDGKPGELAIRGATVFSGYWNAAVTNAKDFVGGWFHMGDLFRRNPDGTIDFVDRAKYMIKSGGENIYPAEIERVLLADARIADAVVVRKQDSKWGEVPVAFVARLDETLTVEDVVALCRENLASYKRPNDVRFIALEDLPRSTTGKIQRHDMEAWL